MRAYFDELMEISAADYFFPDDFLKFPLIHQKKHIFRISSKKV
jgi:hypothetical protein